MERYENGDWVVILRENTDQPEMIGLVGKYNESKGSSHRVDISKEICPNSWRGTSLQKQGNKNFPNGNYYYVYAYQSANSRLPALRHALPHEIPEEFKENVLKSLIIW